ncbi:GNAT domain-containing protein [Apiospora phragmitis]|uniref:GNAT domain-containing protein n=1 Tax=Apiospora phragmitis TaxID=2905665 RepID=A0ABR1TW72_9PEZI
MAAAADDNTNTMTAPGATGNDNDDGDGTVLVRTTLPSRPLPANDTRPHHRTARLLVRPLRQSDLAGLHALRTQPEAMTGTRLGRPDRDLAETQVELDFFRHGVRGGSGEPPYLWGAFLSPPQQQQRSATTSTGDEEEGEEEVELLIGEGGVHTLATDAVAASGWPEIGYKFRREYWGQGYATEFVEAVLGAWWGLPRSTVEIRVNRRAVAAAMSAAANDSVPEDGGEDDVIEATEQMYANAEPSNAGSCRVLEKLGFRRYHEWTEPDTQEHRVGKPLDLAGYLLAKSACL